MPEPGGAAAAVIDIIESKATTRDGRARLEAVKSLGDADPTPVSAVLYKSSGHLVTCSSEALDAEFARRILDTGLKCTFVVSRPDLADPVLRAGPENADQVEGHISSFTGHLGEFRVSMTAGDGEVDASALAGTAGRPFDLVLDLCGEKLVRRDVLPVGYYAPDSEAALDEALEEIPQMVGEFEKPRYFKLDPDVCAHTSRGVVACTRCLDACPTLAITPGPESVVVDPYACQGIGICTTVCPTGAISYAYPPVSDLLDNLRRALHRYHGAEGKRPALLFHDDAEGRMLVEQELSRLPENLIPIEVESVAALGMEVWLSSLAYGARRVFLLFTEKSPAGVAEAVGKEIEVAGKILDAMGYSGDRVAIVRADRAEEIAQELPAKFGRQLVTPAGFAGFDEKRTALRLALDHFLDHAPAASGAVSLPRGSCFGRVEVDRDLCTLCMSCVAVCPASALQAGGASPRLSFLERNCVQCGLCERACPEDAITLDPRFNMDATEASEPKVIHEEEPFHCVKCGAPFSTRKMMDRIREKLADHWMYQDESQVRRLEMCEDCRVQDLFASGGLDPHGGAS